MTGISAHQLHIRRGGQTVLENITLSLPAPGTVAIIGPNGAGKSTLLKLLAGIDAPDSGQVLREGQDLYRLSAEERAQHIGYIPQQFMPHWDHTVSDLIELGASRARVPKADAVECAITDNELSLLKHRRWSILSGGERARVLLGMVLAVDTPVLLADEPGASLDIRHRLDLLARLVRHRHNRLTMVVMHDVDLALRFFDRVVLMDRGRIVFDGASGELMQDPRLDQVFGVRFERVRTDTGTIVLCPTPVG